jgi:uncharacterized FlaG/YvyC family protein
VGKVSEISRSEIGMRDLSQLVLTSTAQLGQHTSWDKTSLNAVGTDKNENNEMKPLGPVHREKLIQEVDRLNEAMKDMGKSLRYKFDDKSEEYYVEVLDVRTQEVIATLPPKYMMELSAKVKDILGLHVDKKI